MRRTIIGAAVMAASLVLQPAVDGQTIHPNSAFRALDYTVHAHGASGDADDQKNDAPPTQYGFWEDIQTASVTKNGATATAANLHRSMIRDDIIDGRAILELGTSSTIAGESASSSADSMLSVNFTVDSTTPVWIREFGNYDGNNTYFYNATTNQIVYSFGSGFGSFDLDPGFYYLHVRTEQLAQCSGVNGSDTKNGHYHLSFVGRALSCVDSFYIGNFDHTTNVSTVHDAHVMETEGILRLTDALEGQTGAAWYVDKAHLSEGFTTSFTFKISNGSADGLAFLIQNESPVSVGAGGSSMGYSTGVQPEGEFLSGITQSVAIEFDTFGCCGELDSPHISVQTQGAGFNSTEDEFSLASATIPTITDGEPHFVTVTYTPGQLRVTLDDTLYIDTALDLGNIDGDNILDENGCAWLGFTAGTGGAVAEQDILNWTFNPCAQSFNLMGFAPNSVTVAGTASVTPEEIINLTPLAAGQAGAAWYASTAHLSNGFDTTFSFQILGGIADGFAFVIQNESSTAVGGTGSDLGYGDSPGITSSLAVEFDTFSFGEPGEFDAPHVSIQTNGISNNSALDASSLGHASIPEIADEQVHTARVRYSSGVMEIWVDGTSYLSVNVDLQNIGGPSILDEGGCAYIGFTAATGGSTAEQNILSWSFTTNLACPNPPCLHVVSWRSVRIHEGDGALAIALDPTASGDGLTGPTVEPRYGGVQEIQVEFDGPVDLNDPFNGSSIDGQTTTDGTPGPLIHYGPSTVGWSGNVVSFQYPEGYLPDQTCYRIQLFSNFLNGTIVDDTDVQFRTLYGDATGDGTVHLSDALYVKSQVLAGKTAVDLPQCDLDLNGGSLDNSDALTAKAEVASPAKAALCP